MGTRSNAPAKLISDLVEIDLAKTFHWTPQQIAAIPYKWIQKYYIIEKVRNEAMDTKSQLQQFNAQANMSGKGAKTFVSGPNVVTSNKVGPTKSKQKGR